MEDYSKIFGEEEERELQRLIRKIKWNQPTIEDMKKVLNYIKTKIFKDEKEVVICEDCNFREVNSYHQKDLFYMTERKTNSSL